MMPLFFHSRALNIYNIFFSIERQKILEQRAHVGFKGLACIVSERWKNIDPAYLKELEEKVRLDRIRFNDEMCEWRKKKSMEELLSLEAEWRDEEEGQRRLTDGVAPLPHSNLLMWCASGFTHTSDATHHSKVAGEDETNHCTLHQSSEDNPIGDEGESNADDFVECFVSDLVRFTLAISKSTS
jgi:hypothetical protein